MAGVIEAAQDPPLLGDDDVGDGGVVGADEGEGPRVGGLVEDLADRAAVGDDDDPLIDVRGRDPLDRSPHPLGEVICRLGARHHVPALLGEHLHRQRVLVGHPLPEGAAALPLPQEHLTQVLVHHGRDAESTGELLPLDVAEGDEVIFSKYGGSEIKVGADEVLILRESDVLAKVVSAGAKGKGKRKLAGATA